MKTSCLVAVASAALGADLSEFCAQQTHGCSKVCGYEAVKAGSDYLCMPSSQPRMDFPFTMDKDDEAEFCQLVAGNHGCSDICGFKYDTVKGECTKTMSDQPSSKVGADPIIGGQGDFKYQYMPDLLKAPAGASLTNCHGLVTDKDGNIYLTYQNDAKTDSNCLIKWNPDGTGGEFMTGGNSTLCSGTPHGLKIKTEDGTPYLYHANNNQKLTKTTLDGTIVWQRNGNFGQVINNAHMHPCSSLVEMPRRHKIIVRV
jgi:hypothetical protein